MSKSSVRASSYCAKCWAELPADGCCDPDDDVVVDESFDSIVDRLMFLRGLDKAEAEALALDIIEADAG